MNTSKEYIAQPLPESSSTDETAQPSTAAEPVSEPSEFPKGPLGKLRTVNYRRLKNLGNYENETVEASAYVLHTQDPAEVLEELRVWVHAQLGISQDDLWRRREEARMLQNNIWGLQAEYDDLRVQIDKMRAWAAEYGMKLTQDVGNTLPF